MRLRELNEIELEHLHNTELREAFPPEELKPYAAMKALMEKGVYQPVGAFEGETLVGYAILWREPRGRYVLIDYLGVTKSRRNSGLGGEILNKLAERFDRLDGIIVESEAPEGGESDALRRRRMDFYRRNGFVFLGYDCVLFGVHYAVALRSPNGRGEESAVLEAHQRLYRAQFTPEAYKTYIQIPRDPESPLTPPESWADLKTLPGLEERSKEP